MHGEFMKGKEGILGHTEKQAETEAETGILSTKQGTPGASRGWKQQGRILF